MYLYQPEQMLSSLNSHIKVEHFLEYVTLEKAMTNVNNLWNKEE